MILMSLFITRNIFHPVIVYFIAHFEKVFADLVEK